MGKGAGSATIDYRPDIDGLRAVAVLSVFAFHLFPERLPGGFLGVDIFFVISGYLITSIIVRENRRGIFSFSRFYARRIKRIFPALFFVLLVSAPIGILLLIPETYTNFMASARYAAGQLANFFFSREVGYFEEGFSGQPLLHTWSLGVEEQFYLCWPLFIVFCFWLVRRQVVGPRSFPAADPQRRTDTIEQSAFTGRRFIFGAFLVLAVVSFVACFILAERDPQQAFYMFYSRAWEFCVGGAVALFPATAARRSALAGWVATAGLVLLGYSFLQVNQDYLGGSFLRFGVLLPCLGAAFLIWAGTVASPANRLLAGPVPVAIGKISYSLYLFHWPIIIFYKVAFDRHEIQPVPALIIVAASLILATLSYFLVEQPARKSRWPDKRVFAVGLLVIAVFASSFKLLEKYGQASWRITAYAEAAAREPKRVPAGCHQMEMDGVHYLDCDVSGRDDAPKIALVGDSHAPHYLPALVSWAEENGYDVIFLGVAGCPMLLGDVRIDSTIDAEHEEQCSAALPFFAEQVVTDPAVEMVLIAQRFDLFYDGKGYLNTNRRYFFKDESGGVIREHTEYFRDRLAETVAGIRALGKEVVLLKQVPLFGSIDACVWEPRLKSMLSRERLCQYDPSFIEKWQRPSITFVEEFARSHQVPVIDPFACLSSPLHGGVNIYGNIDHLNAHGFVALIPCISREMDVLLENLAGSESRQQSTAETMRTDDAGY
ncbi:acyltransferase family protein [Desulfofustis limnaeus]|jgi:peptidoglycan/LPS O-acetylase OafA/YrhL|uniref:Acyltransferase n=1 Tax=Desulfofustis limnaeus TaxID=2740163 RepID=A0ABN6LZZ9_9BACT|nr:acyltransferase family protein [Desulfofustis limnaeus]MDX9896067.1 acyltransferase family protein [Desulfofustis sp.]BDD86213.1 hypothetical protein DPPLL_05780 [Desulfofustis limnaeus]